MFKDSAVTRITAVVLGVLVLTVIVDRYLFITKGTPRPVMNMFYDNVLFGIDADDLISRSYRLGSCYNWWSEAEYPPELLGSTGSSYSEQAKLEKKRDRWMLRRLEIMRGLSAAKDKIKSHLRSRFKGDTGSAAASEAGLNFTYSGRSYGHCSSVGRVYDFWAR